MLPFAVFGFVMKPLQLKGVQICSELVSFCIHLPLQIFLNIWWYRFCSCWIKKAIDYCRDSWLRESRCCMEEYAWLFNKIAFWIYPCMVVRSRAKKHHVVILILLNPKWNSCSPNKLQYYFHFFFVLDNFVETIKCIRRMYQQSSKWKT